MRISNNIVLHYLQDLKPITGPDFNGASQYRLVLPLPEHAAASEECLYLAAPDGDYSLYPECGCLFLCSGALPSAEELRGNIAIGSDIPLYTLMARLNKLFLDLNDWYENMLRVAAAQQDIQEIIRLSEDVIGNYITVSDSALALVAHTANVTIDDPVIRALIEKGYHSEEAYQRFRAANRFDQWMREDGLIINPDRRIGMHEIVSKVFKYDHTYFMHAVMACNHHPPTPGLLELFSIMCEVLETIIRSRWNNEKYFSHNYSAFISDLIHRNGTSDRNSMEKRAKMIGIDPADEYIVIVAAADISKGQGSPGRIAHDIFSMFPRIRVVNYDNRLLFLLHAKQVTRYTESMNFYDTLKEYLGNHNMFCGISDVFQDILELSDAYQQALLAATHSSDIITYFDDVAAYCFLDPSNEALQLWNRSRYGKLLQDLQLLDREKKQNNLALLHAYLKNERRARETSLEVHMHRNNVVYRIKKLEETYGFNLDDPKTRMNLLISFLMFERWHPQEFEGKIHSTEEFGAGKAKQKNP